jgi:aminoglycoside phosphotransferase family enzyme
MSQSEQMLNLQQQASNRVLLRGESLALAEWLEVSWFYPEGFRKERIVETSRAWIVLGNTIVYKFLKVFSSSASSSVSSPPTSSPFSGNPFPLRWQMACEEVIDNRALAPDLYLGLRLLRWIDDEPQWISEKPDTELDPRRPPAGADDVAIIMRRLPEEQLLEKRLESADETSQPLLRKIAARLHSFHAVHSAATPVVDASAAIRSLQEQYLDSLTRFLLTDGPYLDPFTQLAFQEVRNCLAAFFTKESDALAERISHGFFADGHGSLRADRICLSETERGKALSIFGRLPRDDRQRCCDPLRDLAALAADIEVRGKPAQAATLENHYCKCQGSPLPAEMYRFYKLAEASLRARLLFRGSVEDRSALGPAYLSLAFKLALGIENPFFIVIADTNSEEEYKLSKSIGELTGSETLSFESLAPELLSSEMPEEMLLEQLLRKGRQALESRQSVVMHWPLNREEERIRICRFASEQGVRFLAVHCEFGRILKAAIRNRRADSAAPLRRRMLQENTSGRFWPGDEDTFSQAFIEPLLPLPDQALAVLKHLSRREPNIRTVPPSENHSARPRSSRLSSAPPRI